MHESGEPQSKWMGKVGDTNMWYVTDPPYTFERAKELLESPDAGSLKRKLTEGEAKILERVKNWDEFSDLEYQWHKADDMPRVYKEMRKELSHEDVVDRLKRHGYPVERIPKGGY